MVPQWYQIAGLWNIKWVCLRGFCADGHKLNDEVTTSGKEDGLDWHLVLRGHRISWTKVHRNRDICGVVGDEAEALRAASEGELELCSSAICLHVLLSRLWLTRTKTYFWWGPTRLPFIFLLNAMSEEALKSTVPEEEKTRRRGHWERRPIRIHRMPETGRSLGVWVAEERQVFPDSSSCH